jgi:hypothetical protein
MNVRSDELPQPLIAETTTVRIPKGATAKIKLSSQLGDSLKYCLVTRPPKGQGEGSSLARLLVKSFRPCKGEQTEDDEAYRIAHPAVGVPRNDDDGCADSIRCTSALYIHTNLIFTQKFSCHPSDPPYY